MRRRDDVGPGGLHPLWYLGKPAEQPSLRRVFCKLAWIGVDMIFFGFCAAAGYSAWIELVDWWA